MLAAIAQVFDGVVADDDVVVLIATGTNAASTRAQRREMLGDDVLRRWHVVDHDARDPSALLARPHRRRPSVAGQRWVDADVRITTGFVEPHFRGFSGAEDGRPDWRIETVLALHSPTRIADPRATFAVVEGNPSTMRSGRSPPRRRHCLGGRASMRRTGSRTPSWTSARGTRGRLPTARDVAMQPVDGLFDVDHHEQRLSADRISTRR
jgi:hypothetical protein